VSIRNKNIRERYREINEFKRGHQPRSNLVKDENADMLADSHNILNRLIKLCLNETYIEVHIDKYLSHTFRNQIGLKQ
jgi:hypothetical protein